MPKLSSVWYNYYSHNSLYYDAWIAVWSSEISYWCQGEISLHIVVAIKGFMSSNCSTNLQGYICQAVCKYPLQAANFTLAA